MKKLYAFVLLCAMALGASAQAPLRKLHKAPVADKVTVLPAEDITATGFTARWEPLPGAFCYQVNVYEPVTITEAGKYILLEESFDYVNAGTMVEPYMPYEDSGDSYYYTFCFSDDFDWTDTPDWCATLGVFARGMVDGYIQSPYMDLTANGGKFEIEMCVVGYAGAEVEVVSHGLTEEKQQVTLENSGENWITLEFTNGIHDTYISYADNGISNDPEGIYANCFDFLDHFRVLQEYQVGDVALRPVAVTPDVFGTQVLYGTLPYANGAKHLCFDVLAAFKFDVPDSFKDYYMEYSDWSDMQHVYLEGYKDAIEEVDASSAAPRYFDLQGRAVSAENAKGGVFLKVTGNKTEKIIR